MDADTTARLERAEAMFHKVYGEVVPIPPRESRDTYINHIVNDVFGELWTRDVLSIRDRRLMIIGVAVALAEHGIIEIQLRAAVANGELTLEGLREILLFLSFYVGLPRCGALQAIVYRIIAEQEAGA